MSSENALGADNQQERLDDYLAGYVDGEGSFHVAIQRNPSTRFGWQLVPEFHVSQNPERASILKLLQVRPGCGRIRPKARLVIQNPQRPYAEHGHQPVKRWSDPHGDMGSQAEQKRPGRRVALVST